MVKQKPTKKEMEVVISNLIRQVEYISQKTYEITVTFGLYLDWKNDKDKFNKFLESEVKEAKSKFDNNKKSEPEDSK